MLAGIKWSITLENQWWTIPIFSLVKNHQNTIPDEIPSLYHQFPNSNLHLQLQ